MILKELKCDRLPFWSTWSRSKLFELRYNDRHYGVGDHLLLRETVHTSYEMALSKWYPLEYTGREILVKVTHTLTDSGGIYGLKPGWCVLSIKVLSKISNVVGEE